MPYVYTGSSQSMSAAIDLSDRVMRSDAFWERVAKRDAPFFNTNRSIDDIVARIRAAWSIQATVSEWSPDLLERWAYRNTVAFVAPDVADTLFYHRKYLNNPVGAMVNTLVHEFVHIVDRFHDSSPDWDYTHVGQYSHKPPENQDSAPYWIGNAAELEVSLLTTGQLKSSPIDFAPTPFICGTGAPPPQS